eukprot:80940-Alexandrium_andersonii.AAC.1
MESVWLFVGPWVHEPILGIFVESSWNLRGIFVESSWNLRGFVGPRAKFHEPSWSCRGMFVESA